MEIIRTIFGVAGGIVCVGMVVFNVVSLWPQNEIDEKGYKDNASPSFKTHSFKEYSLYSTKDDYGWTHYYVYLNGEWREYRRVSANGARIYDWNGQKWVRMPGHISRPATGWYKNQNWSAPPRYPSTTQGVTTPGTTSY